MTSNVAVNAELDQEMEFDPTANEGIDPSSVENNGPSFPMLQWHYGDRKNKKMGAESMDYAGGWFANADAVDPAVMVAAGWKKETWTHDNGAETEGYYKRTISVALIGRRERWEVSDGNGGRKTYAWNNYDEAAAEAGKNGKKPSGRMHALVMVKGLESLGPVVLTLKGAASRAFKGSRNAIGVEGRFSQTVIAAANAASAAKSGSKAAKWPYRAFWLPIGADRDADGTPKFTEIGSGKDSTAVVLPVALGLPAKPAEVQLSRHYVGAAMLDTVNTLYAEYGDWIKAWDQLEPGTVEGNGAAAQEATPEQAPPPAVDVLAETGL